MGGLRQVAQFFAVAFFFAVSGTALAQGSSAGPDAAGRFISVRGEVSILSSDGARRAAQRDDTLREGDSIVTGTDSLAQLRLRDGSMFSIRADTQAKLDQFRFAGRDDRDASFAMSIVKGGFRTLTGLIAQLNRSNYRIATPSATIGVRGTHFEAVHLPVPLDQVPAGTYNRVFEGITQMQNPAGNLVVSRNQTAFVGLGNVQPILVAPPPAIFGRPTPVPRAASGGQERAAEKAAPASLGQDGAPGGREAAPGTREGLRRELGAPAVSSPAERAIAPIDGEGPRTLAPLPVDSATRLPGTTTLNPETILQPSTIAPTNTIERSTTISPISPSTTIQPSIQTIQPSTTIQSIQPPTTTLQAPTTTRITTPTPTITPSTTTTTSPTRTISPTISR
jgi:hypothetical protein